MNCPSADVRCTSFLTHCAHFLNQSHCQAYLVGGSVRNLLLQAPCSDWDIVTDGDYLKLGRQLANELGGYYAPMHEKACRIVLKHDQQELVIDLSPLQGGSIEADLQLRDFTLNAIAVPLANMIEHLTANETLAFIDPVNGVADLEAHMLRAINDRVFQDDPLRMLRTARFVAGGTTLLAVLPGGTARSVTISALSGRGRSRLAPCPLHGESA